MAGFPPRLRCRATSTLIALAATLPALALGSPSHAQDGWRQSPGGERPSQRQPGQYDAPGAQGTYQRPQTRGSSLERTELDPVIANDGSGLPMELWRGLDLKTLESLLASLALPPRSATLHALWTRMLVAAGTPPAGASPDHFLAVRLEALYRSGLLAEMDEAATASANVTGPVIAALLARKAIGLGDSARGCEGIKAMADPRSNLPERLRGEAQLLAGFCAAMAGDKNGAGLAASLAREEGLEADLPLAVLAGVAEDTKPHLTLPKRVLLLDYRFLELLGPVNSAQVMPHAEPALLTVLATDPRIDVRTQVAAAEQALHLNAITPAAFLDTLRRHTIATAQAEADVALRHAFLLNSALQRASGPAATRALASVLADARKAGYGLQMAQAIAAGLAQLPAGNDGVMAELATECLLAAGNLPLARQWAQAGPGGLPHWVALMDVVDPARKSWRTGTLGVLEDMAARNRLGPDMLHRLATVLDALDIDVPVPLWDAAGRTAQPTGGFLPETGLLAELAEAAKRRETGRTVLLVMRALGPDGPERANILPLGDAIRAVRRVGLEADARRLALEALLPVWPRLAAP